MFALPKGSTSCSFGSPRNARHVDATAEVPAASGSLGDIEEGDDRSSICVRDQAFPPPLPDSCADSGAMGTFLREDNSLAYDEHRFIVGMEIVQRYLSRGWVSPAQLLELMEQFPAIRARFEAMLQDGSRDKSPMRPYLQALSRFTGLPLPDGLALLTQNPAGGPGEIRLTASHQRGQLEFMRRAPEFELCEEPAAMLQCANFLRSGLQVISHTCRVDGNEHRFEAIAFPVIQRLIGHFNEDKLRDAITRAFADLLRKSTGDDIKIVQLVQCNPEYCSDELVAIDSAPDSRRIGAVNVDKLLEFANPDSHKLWLEGAYNESHVFSWVAELSCARSLINYSFSRVSNSIVYMPEFIYLHGSVFESCRLDMFILDERYLGEYRECLSGVRAYGCEVSVYVGQRDDITIEEAIGFLSNCGIVGLDPAQCTELHSTDSELRVFRLNDAV
jgi:hypothetical protein